MSGIYIPGMEMPKCDIDCPIFTEEICPIEAVSAFSGMTEELHPDCPLVPVPDHGRLGDLDELYVSLKKWLIQNRHSMTEATRVWIRGVLEGIDAAPTIIPASKEGKE